MNWMQKGKNTMQNSVAAKLILAVAGITVLFAGISFGFVYHNSKVLWENNVRQAMIMPAVIQSKEMGLWLGSRKAEITNLAFSPFVKNAASEDAATYLLEETILLKV